MKIIDSSLRFRAHEMEAEIPALLDTMEKTGISHAVISPSDEYVAVYNSEGNEIIERIVRRFPDSFTGLAVVNPWYGDKGCDILRSAFEENLSGLYLHPGRQGFKLTDSIVFPLIEICAIFQKPVYAYCGTPICAMPFQLAELARSFPQVGFVLGHSSWSDFWYDVEPAAAQTDNITIETSCTTGGMVKLFVESLGDSRVIFGSGYPRSMQENEMKKIKRLNFSSDVYSKIMFENAQALWGISI